MRRLNLLIVISFSCLMAVAQGVIKGSVCDAASGEKLPFVTVKVMKAGQKAPVAACATDTEGAFAQKGLKMGSYVVQFTYVGYAVHSEKVTLSKTAPVVDMGRITMNADSRNLGEAVVNGQRTGLKLEVDRKSYNIGQDLSNVGASASEALENIPSVEVDQDGNISLRGSSSVEVWLNGKPSGLTNENRGTILEQIPAESIDRIEIIDNPGSKYSAEGSAGIINIVLKQGTRSGYYGSLQAGGNTAGGANASFNINYNSKRVDVFANVGYRHRQDKSGSISRQDFFGEDHQPFSYQNGDNVSSNRGNNLFTRAGVTLHATKKDDISLSGTFMRGGHNNRSESPYYYGNYILGQDGVLLQDPTRVLTRFTSGRASMMMYNGELDYRHNFAERHFLNFNLTHGSWQSDNRNIYQDSTFWYDPAKDCELLYQSRPQDIYSRWTAVKVDYENMISQKVTLQVGYNADFKHEDTPQESYVDHTSLDGRNAQEDKTYYNRFLYKSQTHALYANATMKFGRFGIQAGLRGEYWHVHTVSTNYDQEHGLAPRPGAYDKDFFQLFPSVFLSYQLTETDQLQLNYSRRLRRPWGGELNSFLDTREATSVRFGNPELTPEYSNSFSLNYLKTFSEHSFLISAYYRPTTSVMQHVTYRVPGDDRLFSTSMNLSRSDNTGVELTLKNKFWQRLDLTTTAAAYYYHLDGFDYDMPDPFARMTTGENRLVHVSGKGQSRFTWNARIKASVLLPWDISVQCTGEYRSRQALMQGYRHPSYGIDFGVKKAFLKKQLTLSINCRDLLDSRKFITTTDTESFHQYAKRWRHARKFNFTLTWTFGNTKSKRPRPEQMEQSEDDFNGGYE